MNYDPNSQPWQPGQPPPPPPQWTTQPQYPQPGQWQTQPGPYPNLPSPDPRFMQQPPRKPNAWQSLSKTGKVSIGCITVVAVLFSCILCSGFHNVGTPTTPQAASVASTPTQAPTAQPAPTATPRPKPTPKPTVQEAPTTAPKAAAPQPPAGPTYNLNAAGGQRVYSPPPDFCSTHACVSTFWTATSGYVVECGNGEYSHSGGISGACSRDGKVAATLYQH